MCPPTVADLIRAARDCAMTVQNLRLRCFTLTRPRIRRRFDATSSKLPRSQVRMTPRPTRRQDRSWGNVVRRFHDVSFVSDRICTTRAPSAWRSIHDVSFVSDRICTTRSPIAWRSVAGLRRFRIGGRATLRFVPPAGQAPVHRGGVEAGLAAASVAPPPPLPCRG